MTFYVFKLIHVSCVLLSICGFVARSGIKLIAPDALQQRWLKIAPHLIDTVLLGSAIVLVVLTRQNPFVTPWLTAKLLGLLAYIGFGLLTLRFAQTRTMILAGFIGACLSFSYIIAVAITRQPWPLN